MISISYILLALSGLAAGFVTAASYVAFIAMLGIFPKVAAKTKTAGECILYENCLILGILLSTLLQFYINFSFAGFHEGTLPSTGVGFFLLALTGLFGGIYIGFLIGGLSEVLNVIPTYARIAHIKNNIHYIIYFLALGKGIFSLIQFFVLNA